VLDDVEGLDIGEDAAVTDCITGPRLQKEIDDGQMEAATAQASSCFTERLYGEARKFGIPRGADGERTLDAILDSCQEAAFGP
jgi:hypothetical protein